MIDAMEKNKGAKASISKKMSYTEIGDSLSFHFHVEQSQDLWINGLRITSCACEKWSSFLLQ